MPGQDRSQYAIMARPRTPRPEARPAYSILSGRAAGSSAACSRTLPSPISTYFSDGQYSASRPSWHNDASSYTPSWYSAQSAPAAYPYQGYRSRSSQAAEDEYHYSNPSSPSYGYPTHFYPPTPASATLHSVVPPANSSSTREAPVSGAQDQDHGGYAPPLGTSAERAGVERRSTMAAVPLASSRGDRKLPGRRSRSFGSGSGTAQSGVRIALSAPTGAAAATATAASAPGVPSRQTYTCSVPHCPSHAHFTRLADLQRHHTTVHLPDRPFPCHEPGCPRVGQRAFTRRDHLVEHLRSCHRVQIPKRKPGQRSVAPGPAPCDGGERS